MKDKRLVALTTAAAAAIIGAVLWLALVSPHAAHPVQASSQPSIPQQTLSSPSNAAQPVAQGSTQPLTQGCNLITMTHLTSGSNVGDWVKANIQPATAAVGAWHFDNPSQKYQSMYFSDPAAPVDIPTFNSAVDAFFVCVSGPATAPAS